MIDLQKQCRQCGAWWLPSKGESYTFPGSACDTGDCICGACEDGDECVFHDQLSEEERKRRETRDLERRKTWGSL